MSASEMPHVDRLRDGDVEALGKFVAERSPQLLSYIQQRLGDALRQKVEAADILQEVAVSAQESLNAVDLSERDPFGWLCQLADRRIVDAHRKHFEAQKRAAAREVAVGDSSTQSRAVGLAELLSVSMTTPSQALSRDQREARMLQAISQLPEESREALRLRYLQGLPTKEIAQRIDKSHGATRVLLSRSLSRLQQLLYEDPLFESYRGAESDGRQ